MRWIALPSCDSYICEQYSKDDLICIEIDIRKIFISCKKEASLLSLISETLFKRHRAGVGLTGIEVIKFCYPNPKFFCDKDLAIDQRISI